MILAFDRQIQSAFALAVLALLVTIAPAQNQPAANTVDPKADAVLRGMSRYYQSLKSFTVTVDMSFLVEMEGMKNQMDTKVDVAFQRPDKYAQVVTSGMMGATVISNGKTLWVYSPATQTYTENELKDGGLKAALELADQTAGQGMSAGAFISSLVREDPYAIMMDGVSGGQYVGLEEENGRKLEHLRFEQADFDWDVWIRAGDQPLLERLKPDLTKSIKQAQEQMGPAAANMKMEMTTRYMNWAVNIDVPANRFEFTPPAAATKSDSLFGAMGEEEIHPLVGKPAPEFTLDVLGGGTLSPSQFKGKSILILDFWATWCGPCVKAMPILVGVASGYKEKGVVLYAVNVQEDADTIKAFLEKQKLAVTVALDKEGKVAGLYGVEGIPQTVIIGKDGTVQVVHVGFRPDLNTVLKTQLDDLLAGKNLAEETLQAKKAKEAEMAKALPTEALEQAWSQPGDWATAAAVPDGRAIYAVSSTGNVTQFSPAGQVNATFSIQDQVSVLRLANLAGDAAPELVTFQGWGPTVKAFDANGTQLWVYKEGQGVDDVCCADLNGDGFDEVIIGYNGGTGIHVLDNRGALLWKYTQIGNVWHVSAGDVNGDGKPEVVTTSAQGAVHVFDAAGSLLKTNSQALYASMVRVGPTGAGPTGAPIYVGGSGNSGEAFTRMGFDGRQAWTATLPVSQTFIDSAAVATLMPWVAVGLRGGIVVVLDGNTGALIAGVTEQGRSPQVAWFEIAGAPPGLLVATGTALNAYQVKPQQAPAAQQPTPQQVPPQ